MLPTASAVSVKLEPAVPGTTMGGLDRPSNRRAGAPSPGAMPMVIPATAAFRVAMSSPPAAPTSQKRVPSRRSGLALGSIRRVMSTRLWSRSSPTLVTRPMDSPL